MAWLAALLADPSAGRKKGNATTGHNNRYLARALGEAAVAAGKTDTVLSERYRRIARCKGKNEPSSPLAAPSWSSSDIYCPTPRCGSTISVQLLRHSASTRNARNATTSANSKRWATKLPSKSRPDRGFPGPNSMFGSVPGNGHARGTIQNHRM